MPEKNADELLADIGFIVLLKPNFSNRIEADSLRHLFRTIIVWWRRLREITALVRHLDLASLFIFNLFSLI